MIKKKTKVSRKKQEIKKIKKIKKNKNYGRFDVLVLEDLEHNQTKPISREVVGFKESHFYGDRLPRKNAILNSSRTRNGAALKFKRKNC
ncbi:hypothetical protein Glove_101g17 [Diversispora epigaea]|uniref:Uncharacterized protein n=1 Tax=Diversispora epigaea TaxID=1348612 RepID=A0A397J691_9GLOM|nr:hypothetical protein Glove_101g17 [Diversispora epigaea]